MCESWLNAFVFRCVAASISMLFSRVLESFLMLEGVDIIWQEKNPDLQKEPFTLEARAILPRMNNDSNSYDHH